MSSIETVMKLYTDRRWRITLFAVTPPPLGRQLLMPGQDHRTSDVLQWAVGPVGQVQFHCPPVTVPARTRERRLGVEEAREALAQSNRLRINNSLACVRVDALGHLAKRLQRPFAGGLRR